MKKKLEKKIVLSKSPKYKTKIKSPKTPNTDLVTLRRMRSNRVTSTRLTTFSTSQFPMVGLASVTLLAHHIRQAVTGA